jgi:hypothetical protein
MANVTLTADEELLVKARAYAQARKTTLNQLIRDYLTRLTGEIAPEQAADEFAELARTRPGRSESNFVFDRRAAHVRGGGRRSS